ncbi:PP2C family protein-serine/threonine phosphatase [Nocardia sp. NRRL S-836]|uniref:PP2C family protein-serine/threonine phosphatase n=1 Tax=Nocardia sp. NRRL S-836 TaxID=1519492 RepID=UPI0006AE6349|nr:SpoIIE family protein phosphatase [Nocardia sp. NRRL S-836]KOV85295.1 histidine kinase [Nocardia sp. NRRL S-836]
MCRADGASPDGAPDPVHAGDGDVAGTDAAFTALLEDSAEDLYDAAPCGYLSTMMDGTIAKINATLLGWLGLGQEAVVGRMRFTDLLTVGGKLYHETHFAPLLRMQGELRGIALEVKVPGGRLPVLVSSVIKRGAGGEPLLIRTTVFDASDRRAYEEELLRRRQEAEQARAAAEQARAAAEQARRQAEADRERLASTLAVLQQTLLPPSLPAVPGVELAGHYHTASPDQLGGDFYDVFPLVGDTWGFFLGDVCGKGVEAAALTSLARYTLRAAAHHHPDDPIAVLAALNTALLRDPNVGIRFCTALYGTLTPGDGGLTVWLAGGGHPPAFHLSGDDGDGTVVRPVELPGAMLVGALADARFVATTVRLEPGQALLLYTDGLTEARGTDGQLLDIEGVADVLAARTGPTTAAAVVADTVTFLAGLPNGTDDDVALLALGVPAAGTPTAGTSTAAVSINAPQRDPAPTGSTDRT